jgi:hypothetical protein
VIEIDPLPSSSSIATKKKPKRAQMRNQSHGGKRREQLNRERKTFIKLGERNPETRLLVVSLDLCHSAL